MSALAVARAAAGASGGGLSRPPLVPRKGTPASLGIAPPQAPPAATAPASIVVERKSWFNYGASYETYLERMESDANRAGSELGSSQLQLGQEEEAEEAEVLQQGRDSAAGSVVPPPLAAPPPLRKQSWGPSSWARRSSINGVAKVS